MATRARPDHDTFVHPALFYRSEQDYLSALIPFITSGLALGEPVAAAVPSGNLTVLRQALGTDAAHVRLLDMTKAGRNPGRIIAGVLRAFADTHPDRHVRIIGEPIWPSRTPTEYPACVQHEALINTAFTDRDVTIVCPYDAARLTAETLTDATATHPLLWEGLAERSSERYAPSETIDRYNLPLDPPPDLPVTAAGHAATGPELSRVRRFTVEQGRLHGLAPERIQDLELIVTELVTNSLLHAQTPGVVHIWPDEDHLICQVSDTGRLTDPLAGRRPPTRGQRGGLGLLLVNDLADLVRTHLSDAGTTIRAYLRRRPQ
ncbi:MAG TPA: sensor histidine kinase [Pseudonocardiaceae bacterium]|nr:sensor histidine kinase [Pseudonocardiaceae bacterium]